MAQRLLLAEPEKSDDAFERGIFVPRLNIGDTKPKIAKLKIPEVPDKLNDDKKEEHSKGKFNCY